MTTHSRLFPLLLWPLLTASAACGGGAAATTEDAGIDTELDGSGDADLDTATDAPPEGSETGDADATTSDTVDVDDAVSTDVDSDGDEVADAPEGSETGDASDLDTDADADSTDLSGADDTDATACEYIDLDIWIVRCDGQFAYARTFTDLGGRPECPPYTTLGDGTYSDAAAAYAELSCDPQCEWRAAMSVSAMCVDGRRTGWIEYRGTEGACEPVFEFAEGLFPSVEAWNAETNCLEGA